MQLVTILQTGDQVKLGLAKGLLEEAEIEYQVRGEHLQHIIGVGTFGLGYNNAAGPAELLVLEDDRERALEVLEVLTE